MTSVLAKFDPGWTDSDGKLSTALKNLETFPPDQGIYIAAAAASSVAQDGAHKPTSRSS